jgi:hypothetical protein
LDAGSDTGLQYRPGTHEDNGHLVLVEMDQGGDGTVDSNITLFYDADGNNVSQEFDVRRIVLSPRLARRGHPDFPLSVYGEIASLRPQTYRNPVAADSTEDC